MTTGEEMLDTLAANRINVRMAAPSLLMVETVAPNEAPRWALDCLIQNYRKVCDALERIDAAYSTSNGTGKPQ